MLFISEFSFGSQSDHRIDFRGATRRDETGDQGHRGEEERRAEKSGEMKRGHTEENALHRSPGEPCAQQTEDSPGGEKTQA